MKYGHICLTDEIVFWNTLYNEKEHFIKQADFKVDIYRLLMY